ncbi:MAG: hypothetical protein J0I09_13315 [Sphingobacteriia bacterium]|nr:hypothetical protein [Sphingobacteriia bacterium]
MQRVSIIIFTAICFIGKSQNNRFIDSLLDNRLVLLHQYKQPLVGNKSIFLKMDFGKPYFTDTTGLCRLTGKEILSVDLLFTDYPSSQDLKPLNKSRLHNLMTVCPYLLHYPKAQWNIIRQLDGKDQESASKLLHGFVINYREPVSMIQREEELNLIKTFDAFVVASGNKPASNQQPKKVNNWSVIHGDKMEAPRFYKGLPIKAISNKPINKSGDTDSLLRLSTLYLENMAVLNRQEHLQYSGKTDSVYVLVANVQRAKQAGVPANAIMNDFRLPDSSLWYSLERLRYRKILIVADVTLSMAQYTVQLLNWLQKSPYNKEVKMITCFNDGDDMPNDKKVLNATGGIYGAYFTNTHEAAMLIENTMLKGSGGDTPENVCEALIRSIEMCSDCNEVILIADNWAAVRDITLLNQIHKPVHIFICGGATGTHIDYINIAYQTKGSLHFEKEDIIDLSALQMGMLIRGIAYKVGPAGQVAPMK